MERLTEKAYGIAQTVKARTECNGKACYKTCEDICEAEKNKCDEGCPIQGVISRLAAYEDTGLTPEEIPHWIPVSERLPETDGKNSHTFDVLVFVPKREGCGQSGYYLGKLRKVKEDSTGSSNFWGIKTPGSEWTLWGWGYFEEPIPSHWMPLPERPKEDIDA